MLKNSSPFYPTIIGPLHQKPKNMQMNRKKMICLLGWFFFCHGRTTWKGKKNIFVKKWLSSSKSTKSNSKEHGNTQMALIIS